MRQNKGNQRRLGHFGWLWYREEEEGPSDGGLHLRLCNLPGLDLVHWASMSTGGSVNSAEEDVLFEADFNQLQPKPKVTFSQNIEIGMLL